LLGVLAALAALAVRAGFRAYLQIDEPRPSRSDPVEVAFAFLLLGPLDEALRLAASLPGLRATANLRGYDAMRVSVGAGLGFVCVTNVARVLEAHQLGVPLGAALVARIGIDTVSHVSLTSLWGFAIGRSARRLVGGVAFSWAFTMALGLSTTVSYLLFSRGPNALAAALPTTALAGLVALVARRDLLRVDEARRSDKLSRLLPVAPPSIEDVEAMLEQRPGRRIALWKVGIGALVTTGALVVGIALAVYAGHRLGVDFSAIDERTGLEHSGPPLLLLSVGAFGAFPFAGFLIAKGLATSGMLEPALGASLALLAVVVALGLAAPIAIVFAIAIAPVAFALTCAGAWTGLGR
jgi:hypothetical protein